MSDEELLEAWNNGATLRELAARCGLSISDTFHRLHLLGAKPRRDVPLTPSQDDQVSTLEWLTQRLFELRAENDALRAEVARLKGERD